MVKDGAFPGYGTRMAELTVGGKICCQVIGVSCGLEFARMTSGAFGCGPSEAPTAVALPTFDGTMLALQTKAGHRLVVPRAGDQILPRLRGVAASAVYTELQVVRIVSSSIPVTCLAALGSSPDDPPQMTGTAFHHPVPTQQRKAGVIMRSDQGLANVLTPFLGGGYGCGVAVADQEEEKKAGEKTQSRDPSFQVAHGHFSLNPSFRHSAVSATPALSFPFPCSLPWSPWRRQCFVGSCSETNRQEGQTHSCSPASAIVRLHIESRHCPPRFP